VGVGQAEVDIARTADVCVVVLVPGTGDEVQALKAGIMEIADLFVVNKSDREGADRMVSAVETVLGLAAGAPDAWTPPVLKTEATRGVGIQPLLEVIDTFRSRETTRLDERRRERVEYRLRDLLSTSLMNRAARRLAPGEIEHLARQVADRALDPYAAVAGLLDRVCGAEG
jgi:LAO/AO transport system kinase